MAPRMVAPKIRLSYELRTQDDDDKHRFGINAISVDKYSKNLYTGGRDGTVRKWDIAHCNGADESADSPGWYEDESIVTPPLTSPPITHLSVSKAHTDWVNDLFVTPDGRTVVSCSSDKTVHVTDTASMTCDTSLVAHTDYVKRLAYAPATNGFASAGLDGAAYLWDLSTISSSSQALRVIPSQQDVSIYALDMDTSGHRLATGGTDRVVRVWDTRTQQRPVSLKGHGDNVKVIRFMDNMVLSGASDGSVVLWDMRQHRILHTYYIHSEGIWCLSIAQGKDRMWTSGRDGNVVETTFVDKESTLLFHEPCPVHAITCTGADSNTFWVGTTHSDVKGWGYNHNRTTPHDRNRQEEDEKDPLKPRPSMFGDRPTVSHTQQYNTDNTSPDDIHTHTHTHTLSTNTTGQVSSMEGGLHPDVMIPVIAAPKYVIEGTSGIIKYQLLNAKCKVLSLDDRGHVALWDLLTASLITDYGQVDFEETLESNFELEFVSNWCIADHNTGTLTIHLDSPSCFSAEVYRDVVQIMGQDTDLAQEKINLGYLVIKRLCANWDPHGRASGNGEAAKVVVMGSVPRARPDHVGGWVNGKHVTMPAKTPTDGTGRRCSTPPHSQQMTGESETQTSSPAHTHNTDQTNAQKQQPNGTTAQEALSTTRRGSNTDSDRTTDTDTDTDASGDTKEKMRSNRSHKDSASDNTTADDKAHSSEGKTNAKNSTLLGANHCATTSLTTATATATATATSPLLNLEGVKGNRANTSKQAYDTQDTPGITTAPSHTDAPAYTAQTNGKQQDNTTKSGTESGTGTGTERREGDGSAQPQSHQLQTQPMHHTHTANAPQNNAHHSADGHSRRSSEQAEAQDMHSHTAHQHNTQQRKTQNGMQHDGPLTKEAAIKREFDDRLFPPMSGHTPIRLTEVAPNIGIVYFQMVCSDFTTANGCDLMMTNAPGWLKDAVFRNQRPPINDTVKITFYVDPVITPCQVPGGALVHLPDMPQGNRLSASRALRVRRILRYIVEKVGPAIRELCRFDATQQEMEDNPGDYLELLCMGKPLLTRTTLGAIKYHLWASAEDITLHYRVVYKAQLH